LTSHIDFDGENVLAVEVACTPPADRRAKRNITGVFEHWDCLDPDWNPGGLWRPVHVEATRRDRSKAWRRNLITPGVNDPTTALPPTNSVS